MGLHLKLFGERNTATRYLSSLIDLNLEVDQLPGTVPEWMRRIKPGYPGSESLRDLYFRLNYHRTLGWKHGRVDVERLTREAGELTRFVCIVKNPYAWLLSLYRRPYHQRGLRGVSLEAFLERPWRLTRRDNCEGGSLPSPVALWNVKNRSYLDLVNQANGYLMTTEQLQMDPAREIAGLARHLDVSFSQPGFRNHETSTKQEAAKDYGYYRDFYGNERWRGDLTSRSISMINAQVDAVLADSLGYQLLTP